VGFAFNSNATSLAAPDSGIFQSPRREHAPAFGLDRACEQRSADRAFVEMIGLGSISQPTGLKRIDLELRKRHGLGEQPVPCARLAKRARTRTDC
jgi:hypothetical protein